MDSKTPRHNLELSITDAKTITDHIWYYLVTQDNARCFFSEKLYLLT